MLEGTAVCLYPNTLKVLIQDQPHSIIKRSIIITF